ncbi:J domain-containing protein [Fundidesulfovibrio agrisoli]|uniref:J domain-containing protein n=1 Tax=Fundidesulfovibrio agrisoli TaxID=2922717 RepID=UPI001FAC34B8|nr:J domain-containing protein [Fundidesulfovibrio agrisoli]
MSSFSIEKILVLFELNPGATFDEFKLSYRQLCMVWHPDRQPGNLRQRAENKLKELNAAFEWLVENKDQLNQRPNSSTQEIKAESEACFPKGNVGFSVLGKQALINEEYLKECLRYREYLSFAADNFGKFEGAWNNCKTLDCIRDVINKGTDHLRYPVANFIKDTLVRNKILNYSAEDIVSSSDDEFFTIYHYNVLERFDGTDWRGLRDKNYDLGMIFQSCQKASFAFTVDAYKTMQGIVGDNGYNIAASWDKRKENFERASNVLENLDSSRMSGPEKIDTILTCIALNPIGADLYDKLIVCARQAGASGADFSSLVQFVSRQIPFVAECSREMAKISNIPDGAERNEHSQADKLASESNSEEELGKAWQEFKEEMGKNPIVKGFRKLFKS